MNISQEDREIRIKSYEVASRLLNARASLRDNALLAYLTASGTIFGFVIGKSVDPELLLIVPYLAVGISIMISHHHLLIGSVLDYMENKLKIEDLYFYKSNTRSLLLRTGGHLIIILMPCIAAMAINWKSEFNFSLSIDYMWWFAAICTSLTIIVLSALFVERNRKISNR